MTGAGQFPPDYRSLELTRYDCGDIAVDTFFNWKPPKLDITAHKEQLIAFLAMRREDLESELGSHTDRANQILLSHSSHMDADIFNIVSEIDTLIRKLVKVSHDQFTFEKGLSEIADDTIDLIAACNALLAYVLKQKSVNKQET